MIFDHLPSQPLPVRNSWEFLQALLVPTPETGFIAFGWGLDGGIFFDLLDPKV